MTKIAEYKYLGKDNIYGLKHGKKYKLAIYKMSWFERLFSKYPINWYIVAYRPFEHNTCLMPYKSQAEFNNTWIQVPAKNLQQSEIKPLIPVH